MRLFAILCGLRLQHHLDAVGVAVFLIPMEGNAFAAAAVAGAGKVFAGAGQGVEAGFFFHVFLLRTIDSLINSYPSGAWLVNANNPSPALQGLSC